MRLRQLELGAFKKFEQPVRVQGLVDGLNVLIGPNEMGKSTLLAGLQAVLFERHRSSAQAIKDYEPADTDGMAPWVALEFDLADGRHRLEKRFLRRPRARLGLPDGRRLEGDAAEDELARLLKVAPPGRARPDADQLGVWSMLLVTQGQSFAPLEIAPDARATLMTCLDAEVEQILGGAQARALLKTIDAALAGLVTKTGRPREAFAQAKAELVECTAEVAGLEAERDQFREDLDRLEDEQSELARLAAEQAAGDDRTALELARQQREDLLTREGELKAAEVALERASHELAQAETAVAERQRLIQARAAAAAEAEVAGETVRAANTASEDAAREAAAGANALDRLEQHAAKAATVTRKLAALERAARDRDQSRTALDAAATEIRVTLAPDAAGKVAIDGHKLTDPASEIRAVDPLVITVAGVGRFEIRPTIQDRERLVQTLTDAERRLEDWHALQLDPADPRPRQLALGLATGLAEDAGPAPLPPLGLPDTRTVEHATHAAEIHEHELGEQLRAARVAQQERLRVQHDCAAAHQQARARAETAGARLAELDPMLARTEPEAPAAALAETVVDCRTRVDDATASLAALRARNVEVARDTLEGRIEALAKAIDARAARVETLRIGIGRRQERIELRVGDGIVERLDEAQRRRQHALDQHATYEREAAVLSLLAGVLHDAERDAKQQLLEPLVARLQPYLEILLPGARLEVDAALNLTGVGRGDGTEAFARLSDGTREQLAILARLAFAEMLADEGLPAVVVLDDALVFSDDERIRRMFKILERAAAKVQIVLLTCRAQLFAELPGHRLTIEPATTTVE